jgi:hypothetical protein
MRYEYRFETFTPAQLEATTHQDYINGFTAEGWRLQNMIQINDEEILLTFERSTFIAGPPPQAALSQLVEEARRQGFKLSRE